MNKHYQLKIYTFTALRAELSVSTLTLLADVFGYETPVSGVALALRKKDLAKKSK